MTERTLNDIMEIDHVIRVSADGVISEDTPGIYAPEVFIPTHDGQILADDEQEMTNYLRGQGWEPVTGWSGQYSYAGPIMHPSEYVGGALETHIRETPGYWVACVATCDDDEIAGWLLLFREIPEVDSSASAG